MAETPPQRRGSYIWLWIILGIVIVIALIWWASDAHTSRMPASTTGAMSTTVRPGATEYGTANNDMSSQPNMANQDSSSGPATNSTAANPPAMSDSTAN